MNINAQKAKNGGDGGNRNRVQNWLTKGSTSVVYRLSYPLTYRRQTAYTLRYPLIPDESRGALPFMFATKSTLCPKPWHSLEERKLLITQRELLIYCCQLILKCYFYRGATPLLADQGSPNLSKSFHPHFYLYFGGGSIPLPILQCTVNVSLRGLFGSHCPLIIELFTLAQADL